MSTGASNPVGCCLSPPFFLVWVTLLKFLHFFKIIFSINIAGDRLLSVNDMDLEGLSYSTVVDVLQNTPDDVTLVVSQPKERLYKGEGGIPVALCVTFKGPL